MGYNTIRYSKSSAQGLIGQQGTYNGGAQQQVDDHDTQMKTQGAALGEGNAGSNELASVMKQTRDRAVQILDGGTQAKAASLKSDDIKTAAATRATSFFGNRG